ncbi:hypothetical protein B0H13DRAFT_1946269, partial [Mycena leptocephala]
STYRRPAPVPSFLLFPAHPSARLSFIAFARTPSLALLLPTSAFSSLLPRFTYRLCNHAAPFLVPPFQFCPAYRPILVHISHSTSCPPPPPLCFPYAATPLSADTSCTGTPFRPTFVASVSISSLALHICLHPLSCRFPCLPRAVLLDWIRRC